MKKLMLSRAQFVAMDLLSFRSENNQPKETISVA